MIVAAAVAEEDIDDKAVPLLLALTLSLATADAEPVAVGPIALPVRVGAEEVLGLLLTVTLEAVLEVGLGDGVTVREAQAVGEVLTHALGRAEEEREAVAVLCEVPEGHEEGPTLAVLSNVSAPVLVPCTDVEAVEDAVATAVSVGGAMDCEATEEALPGAGDADGWLVPEAPPDMTGVSEAELDGVGAVDGPDACTETVGEAEGL